MYLISEVAKLSGISVRTLRHYHDLELLIPDKVDQNGYRLYSMKNLETLQIILYLKELDFSLKEIKKILLDENYSPKDELKKQRDILVKRRERLDNLISTIDTTLTSIKEGKTMNPKEMFNSFNTAEIEREVEENYGNSDQYRESKSRTGKYSPEDWKNIELDHKRIMTAFAKHMEKSPDDKDVQKLVEEWKKHISTYFYECSNETLKGLGETYVNDNRFTKNIDKHGEGLSLFLKEAIDFYCNK